MRLLASSLREQHDPDDAPDGMSYGMSARPHAVGAADMLFALAPRHRGSSSVAGRPPPPLQLQSSSPPPSSPSPPPPPPSLPPPPS